MGNTCGKFTKRSHFSDWMSWAWVDFRSCKDCFKSTVLSVTSISDQLFVGQLTGFALSLFLLPTFLLQVSPQLFSFAIADNAGISSRKRISATISNQPVLMHCLNLFLPLPILEKLVLVSRYVPLST